MLDEKAVFHNEVDFRFSLKLLGNVDQISLLQ